MSPYQFARLECADFISGRCIWTKDGGCLLASKPMKPCRRFEKNVLNLPQQPVAEKNQNYFSYIQARQSYLRARKQEISEVDFRKCPGCGESLRKRQRFCGQCVNKHGRQAARERKQRQRQKQQAEYRMSVTL